MSLNTIHLTNRLITELYSHNLIDVNATTVPEPQSLKYLGNHQKNILVVVSHQSIPFLPDNELNFLTTVFAACKLSIADIAIINNNVTDVTQLQNIINETAKNILLFGVEPLSIGMPINFPQFQLQQFNKRIYLHAPALSQIENDKGLKAKLWSALKVLFEI